MSLRATVLLLALGASSLTAFAAPTKVYRCLGKGVLNYTSKPIAGAECALITAKPAPQVLGRNPSSILPACSDPAPAGPVLGVGPSARARECTRVLCAKPANQIKVKRYAMSEPLSEVDSHVALTCITRKEQDLGGTKR